MRNRIISCHGGGSISERLLTALVALLFLPSTLCAQESRPGDHQSGPPQSAGPSLPYEPLKGREKAGFYLDSILGPAALAGAAASAGVKQAWNRVPEWGQGLEGYGKRFASQYGQTAIRYSVQHGLGALMKEDPRYFRSDRAGFWPRTGHALAHTFRARGDDGKWTFSEPRLAGMIASSMISRTWHPDPERSIADGFESAGYQIGIDAAFNFLREFWPDIWKKLGR